MASELTRPNTSPFLFGEYVEGKIYFSPLPRTLQKLKAKIIPAVKDIDSTMAARVWDEIPFSLKYVPRDPRMSH